MYVYIYLDWLKILSTMDSDINQEKLEARAKRFGASEARLKPPMPDSTGGTRAVVPK